VAAFMAGLGGGSVLGAKKAVESRSPLIVFAVLEAAVALYALLMPWITSVMSDWMIAWASESGLGVWYGVQSLLMLMLMLFPAMAMGYGYACVVESARRYSAGRFELGQLYGLNTLGGATGALLSVALLAAGGWKNAVYIIAFTGFAVAALATYLALTREGRIALLKKDHGRVEGGEKDFLKAALLYGLVGMAAMIIQIGWVRVFGMIMLRTEYVLALIVMVFLAGIAAGSLIERRLKDRKII
ncbi:MAG: hypothetical protein GWO08_11160, partial [Gammaproteobacteria bacterium]|nr:hypothetical protein [Gammaproteobacteria bacterium]NIR94197.1 hypothetical protein [Gammaproteobacteria bacterium]NIW49369.1 hypothetical protein [Gammaproteobacteria bacterium]NIX59146.1 hypothetical protein [candidate division Zixibacteria bacterium]